MRKVQEYIRAGDAFQVVLSQRFDVPRQGVDPFDVYRLLRVTNPSPYMFHLEFPEAVVTGASPECLVRLDGRRIEVRPIAGTRRRGRTPEEDVALERELLADEKERAEHVMLIDLGRNDVGRVAAPGHGEGRRDDGGRALLPRHAPGLERQRHAGRGQGRRSRWCGRPSPPAPCRARPRSGPWRSSSSSSPPAGDSTAGAVGYLSYSGNADLAIAIRTLVTRGDTIHVQAGAGHRGRQPPRAASTRSA